MLAVPTASQFKTALARLRRTEEESIRTQQRERREELRQLKKELQLAQTPQQAIEKPDRDPKSGASPIEEPAVRILSTMANNRALLEERLVSLELQE